MDKRLLRRIGKIEQALEPEEGTWLRLPDGKGGFIEVPGCQTLLDVVAMSMAGDKKLNKTERN